jgi:hypothetical protein
MGLLLFTFSLSRRTLLREVNFLFARALGNCMFHVDGGSELLRNTGGYLSDYTQLHIVTEVGTTVRALICAQMMECLKTVVVTLNTLQTTK